MSSSAERAEDILRDALPTAFSQPVDLRSSASQSPSSSNPPPIPAPTSAAALENPPSAESPQGGDDSGWRQEYDARVSEWRAQSAVARQLAEERRESYEKIRAEEAKQQVSESTRQPLPSAPGSNFSTPVSTVDSRDLVTGEPQGHHLRAEASTSSPPVSVSHPSDAEHEHEDSRWENVPSVASSFPSLPSRTSPPSQPRGSTKVLSRDASSATPDSKDEAPRGPGHPSGAHGSQPSAAEIAKPQPPSVTPLILDTTLTVKTRTLALLSSLAINMFLPFVNGVMLGFGEIFARNVLAPWIGWQSVLNPNGTRTLQPATKSMSGAEMKAASRREAINSKRMDL